MWFQYWDVSLRWQQPSLHDNDSFAHNFEQQQIIFFVTHYLLRTKKS